MIGRPDRNAAFEKIGAGEGNRTLVIGLEGLQKSKAFNPRVQRFSVCAKS